MRLRREILTAVQANHPELTSSCAIGCVAYFPVVALLSAPDPLGAPAWLLPLTPAVGFLFLAVALRVWGLGLAKYASTGS